MAIYGGVAVPADGETGCACGCLGCLGIAVFLFIAMAIAGWILQLLHIGG